jgi:hypothetical protein
VADAILAVMLLSLRRIVDERTQVAKCACEADESVGNRELCCLSKFATCNVVLFSLSRFLYVIVVGGRKYNASPGCLVGAGCGGRGHKGGV